MDKKAESALVIPNSLPALQALLDNNNIMNIYMGSGLVEVGADDFYISGASYNALSELEKQAYTWRPYAYLTVAERNMNYSNIYRVVFNANTVLEQLKKIDGGSSEIYNSIKGSALFFGHMHFINWLKYIVKLIKVAMLNITS
ncbi:RagB/SusD family nutrient uptake outer membrane protein [Sphingobacterium sp. E70]|uniref:RagB/SusD family nutrient uptake outer membrane protein n=1 Tax=Sphingobacterium sp. E70 TaxID=2853439 RepID=UPI00211C3701|nr:RagB/SusD family nutrient uptake outer membrane protein [Sphingobacterium sp. E70]ULT28213.1 RagB/SusD family nutrient uptake outer membrane protein [Sphingobacterium sp. E70]